MDADYFRTLARYNAWANRRLYAACGALSSDEIAAPRPSFFGSILATLNHLLVADRIWVGRIAGVPAAVQQLNAVLHADFPALRTAREAEDARLLALVEGLDEARLAGTLSYANTAGRPFETPLRLVLAHLFNHQAHHRGQTHGLLSQTEVPPPSLDLIAYVREAGAAG